MIEVLGAYERIAIDDASGGLGCFGQAAWHTEELQPDIVGIGNDPVAPGWQAFALQLLRHRGRVVVLHQGAEVVEEGARLVCAATQGEISNTECYVVAQRRILLFVELGIEQALLRNTRCW